MSATEVVCRLIVRLMLYLVVPARSVSEVEARFVLSTADWSGEMSSPSLVSTSWRSTPALSWTAVGDEMLDSVVTKVTLTLPSPSRSAIDYSSSFLVGDLRVRERLDLSP